MTEEKIFYEDQDMKVTSARVIAKNQTFAMAGITSVEVKREDHKVSMLPALVTMMLGLGAMPTSWVMGSVIVVVSIYLFVKESSAPPIFHLVLRTAGSASGNSSVSCTARMVYRMGRSFTLSTMTSTT